MHIWLIDKLERVLWPGQQREAATVFKRGGVYFMLTSACTGWAPNQGSYAWSRSLTDGWSQRYPFGDETTYRSQPTWVLPVDRPETGETEYLYIGDRWGGSKGYFESSYVRLPIAFDSDIEIHILGGCLWKNYCTARRIMMNICPTSAWKPT